MKSTPLFFLRYLLGATMLLSALGAAAQNGKTEVLWLGQAATRITTPGGKVIVVDPWLRSNVLTQRFLHRSGC